MPSAEANPGDSGPYHLVNTTLNVPSSTHAALRHRKSDFFLFSKYWSGSRDLLLPYRRAAFTIRMERPDYCYSWRTLRRRSGIELRAVYKVQGVPSGSRQTILPRRPSSSRRASSSESLSSRCSCHARQSMPWWIRSQLKRWWPASISQRDGDADG